MSNPLIAYKIIAYLYLCGLFDRLCLAVNKVLVDHIHVLVRQYLGRGAWPHVRVYAALLSELAGSWLSHLSCLI